MVHILRLNEMAVRYSDKIDGAFKRRQRLKEDKSDIKSKEIEKALRNVKNQIGSFPTADAIDAIDTYNYLSEKGLRDRVIDENLGHLRFADTRNEELSYVNGYQFPKLAFSEKASLVATYTDLRSASGEDTIRLYLGYDTILKDIVIWFNRGWTGKMYDAFRFNDFIDRCRNYEDTADADYDFDKNEVLFRVEFDRDAHTATDDWVSAKELVTRLRDTIKDLKIMLNYFFSSIDDLE
jgi:hypothetical protein